MDYKGFKYWHRPRTPVGGVADVGSALSGRRGPLRDLTLSERLISVFPNYTSKVKLTKARLLQVSLVTEVNDP